MTTAAVETHTGRKRRSITAQPWFPTFVGVWFAALFGLSSLAMPVPLLERIVSALGIDGVFPAAAPPLGQTARMLLVLGFSGIGEIVGLLIGRRFATRNRAAAEADRIAPRRGGDEHPDAPPRKPLSALDDLRIRDEELPSAADHEDETAPAVIDHEWASEPAIEATPVIVEGPLAVAELAPEPRIVQTKPRPAVATAALDSLGVVQLSERLALAIATRRERQSGTGETLSPAPVGHWAQSDTQPQAVEIDELPVVAEVPWGDILLQRARREIPPVASIELDEPEEFVSDHDDIEDETADAPYSSLLDIRPSHLRHASVEVDLEAAEGTEPVVDIFRDAEPSDPTGPVAEADPAETDRALKAALESLQRISGTR